MGFRKIRALLRVALDLVANRHTAQPQEEGQLEGHPREPVLEAARRLDESIEQHRATLCQVRYTSSDGTIKCGGYHEAAHVSRAAIYNGTAKSRF